MGLSQGELVLGRYVIESRIGEGGMGEVYRARHQTLGMPVAVKAITGESSPELVARFAREAQLLARVRHPNVVSILDVGNTADGAPCMVMEFLEGESLEARLSRRKALPWREVQAIGLSILKGLGAIHDAGIVHRDLKPANVLITRGNPSVVKLVDFGIAHPTSTGARKFTRTGAVIGTPAYMAPEQLVAGDVNARSDLYSLGLVLYELAAGALPFGDDANAALRRLSAPIPAPQPPAGMPALPAEGAAAIMSALALDPAQRPSDATAFARLLRGGGGGGDTVQTPLATATVAAASAPARTQAAPAARENDVGRCIVAARVPVSRMAQRTEQQALAQLAAPGRAYHLGGGVWFAVVPVAGEPEAEAMADRIGGALRKRYGATCKVVWSTASNEFGLTPASLAGSAPLPDEITRLLGHLL